MADSGNLQITVFTDMFNDFDNSLLNVINSGSANIITLITPLMTTGFAIYVMLVMASYWRGHSHEPVPDFIQRMAGWAVVLTLGMNIGYYSEYVVPFFNGLGDDIARALSTNTSTGSALDTVASSYAQAMWQIFKAADGIEETINAIAYIIVMLFFGAPFMGIAAAYIILARFALGLLLALGPMFISAALFPATRRFCEAWIGQCLSYVFLVALMSAAGLIELRFAQSIAPSQATLGSLIKIALMGVSFIVISLNLPGLASQLAGGVGISSMVGKMGQAARAVKAIREALKGSGGKGGAGGSMEGTSGAQPATGA
ncbi:type IV secretion system protein [Ralstonia pseudosolanacearum]|uniref:type IV secretion system protein n=1 Tax=Ralstonia pseudosolanacearum TaxID=1310165 RepID=UPI003AAA87E2